MDASTDAAEAGLACRTCARGTVLTQCTATTDTVCTGYALCVGSYGNGGRMGRFDGTSMVSNRAPEAQLVGAMTGLDTPSVLAVDFVHDEIVIPMHTAGTIRTYPRNGNGDVAPTRTLSGASTLLSNPTAAALDLVNDEMAVSTEGSSDAIRVFARTANGDVAPLRSIVGNNTGLNRPQSVIVDSVNDELIVANNEGEEVLVFSRTASGNVVPLRTITLASKPNGLGFDPVNNEIYVADTSSSIRVFARAASGAATPLRTISGSNTTLSNNQGAILVDPARNLVHIADFDNDAVSTFSRSADGNIAPIARIVGSNTQLSRPWGLAYCD